MVNQNITSNALGIRSGFTNTHNNIIQYILAPIEISISFDMIPYNYKQITING